VESLAHKNRYCQQNIECAMIIQQAFCYVNNFTLFIKSSVLKIFFFLGVPLWRIANSFSPCLYYPNS